MKQGNGKVRYGIDNPHPLSQLTTELVWEGKYDEYGNRREVDIAGSAMPMQKIETIDEPRSRAAAEGQLELFGATHLIKRCNLMAVYLHPSIFDFFTVGARLLGQRQVQYSRDVTARWGNGHS